MRSEICAALVAAALFSLTSATADQPERFMSLKMQGAEGRHAPNAEARVEWLYQHTGLPMQVLAENGAWLRVRDPDGDESWMQANDLGTRRTIYVQRETTLRRTARSGGQAVAQLMPGVIGGVTACDGEWRRITVGGRVGWVENAAIWGGDCAGLSSTIRP